MPFLKRIKMEGGGNKKSYSIHKKNLIRSIIGYEIINLSQHNI